MFFTFIHKQDNTKEKINQLKGKKERKSVDFCKKTG